MSKKRMITKIPFVLLCAIASISLGIVSSNFDNNSKNIQIKDLKVCTKNIVESGNSMSQSCGKDFSSSTTQIFVCGNITSAERVMPPTLYLFKDGQKYPIYDAYLKKTGNGNFCQPISLASNHQNGVYTIKFYNYRNLIATTYFRVP